MVKDKKEIKLMNKDSNTHLMYKNFFTWPNMLRV